MSANEAGKARTKSVGDIIDEINKRLDGVEENLYWMIPANQRFKKGSRVQYSAIADRCNIPRHAKGGVRTGIVVAEPNGFSVKVLLDGHKKPSGFHHMFFELVRKKGVKRGK